MSQYNFVSLIGKTYGYFTILERDMEKPKKTYWICQCDCGVKKSVRGDHLKEGRVKSCGCKSAELNTKHGMTRTPTYICWQNMKERCGNKNNRHYNNYGGRGIKVCPEWSDFDTFFRDMGEMPRGMTIDRIDNDRGYFKENCQWATRKEQVNNRRNSILFTHDGETMCLKDWCRRFGKHYNTAMYHYKKGRTFEEIFGL